MQKSVALVICTYRSMMGFAHGSSRLLIGALSLRSPIYVISFSMVELQGNALPATITVLPSLSFL